MSRDEEVVTVLNRSVMRSRSLAQLEIDPAVMREREKARSVGVMWSDGSRLFFPTETEDLNFMLNFAFGVGGSCEHETRR